MMSKPTLISRAAPWLACLGLLGIWQVAAIILNTDSFPTAWESIRDACKADTLTPAARAGEFVYASQLIAPAAAFADYARP